MLYSRLFNALWERGKRSLLDNQNAALAAEYAIKEQDADREVSRHKEELLAALLARLQAVCQSRGMRLVIVDIPSAGPGNTWKSSIPPALMNAFRRHCDALICSRPMLRDREKPGEVFVPHGQRHISETTHRLLGDAAAAEIAALCGPTGSEAQ